MSILLWTDLYVGAMILCILLFKCVNIILFSARCQREFAENYENLCKCIDGYDNSYQKLIDALRKIEVDTPYAKLQLRKMINDNEQIVDDLAIYYKTYSNQVSREKELSESLTTVQSQLNELESILSKYIKLSFMIKKRFDTDPESNKAMYEAIVTSGGFPMESVLIADESQISDSIYGGIELLVKDLGEKQYINNVTNQYTGAKWQNTVYRHTYITVDKEYNEENIKNKIHEARTAIWNANEEIKKIKMDNSDAYEKIKATFHRAQIFK